MSDFPTLTDAPDVDSWEEQRAYDPTIRAKSEGGYVKTRPRYTRVPMQWKLKYSYLSATDKTTLQAFENTVRVGADAFNWTNPDSGAVHVVRFKEPIKFAPVGCKLRWRAEMTLEEV